MFDTNPQMNKLMTAVDVADPNHSGSSMGWTMRQLQQVAKTGYV